MFKKIIIGVTFLITSMLLFSCARVAPVVNLHDEVVPAHLTRHQVGVAIQNAAQERRFWHVAKVKPGMIRATVFVRNHRATVMIPYSSHSYSIVYQSSYNLKAGNGKIHRNYNKWVLLLNRDIQYHLHHQTTHGK